MLKLDLRLSAFKSNPNGTATISFNNNYTVLCGDGVQFVPKHCEVWYPQLDAVPTASTTNAESQQVTPTGAARAKAP